MKIFGIGVAIDLWLLCILLGKLTVFMVVSTGLS